MFVNRMPRYEPLSEDALATIDRGWERVAREIGVQFDHPRALELFAAAGQTVDGDTVRFDPDFLKAQAALAPSVFSLRARNRARDVVVGGDHMVFGPAQGPPFVRIDGERRDGTLADLEDLLRLHSSRTPSTRRAATSSSRTTCRSTRAISSGRSRRSG